MQVGNRYLGYRGGSMPGAMWQQCGVRKTWPLCRGVWAQKHASVVKVFFGLLTWTRGEQTRTFFAWPSFLIVFRMIVNEEWKWLEVVLLYKCKPCLPRTYIVAVCCRGAQTSRYLQTLFDLLLQSCEVQTQTTHQLGIVLGFRPKTGRWSEEVRTRYPSW